MTEFAKTILIRNPRIKIASVCLHALVFIVALYTFLVHEVIWARIGVSTETFATLIVPEASNARLVGNSTVPDLPVCQQGLRGSSCIVGAMRYEQGSSAHAFVVTSLRRTMLTWPDSSGTSLGANIAVVPSADDFKVAFDFSYAAAEATPIFFVPRVGMGERVQGSSRRDAVTALLDHKGELVSVWQPGERIELSMPELARLAGSPFSLDGRVQGLELGVAVDCYNADFLLQQFEGLSVGFMGHEAVCAMRFKILAQHSVRRHLEAAPQSTESVLVESSGIHVRCLHGGGKFVFWDGYGCLVFVVGVAVLMRLPGALVRHITLWWLGQLSAIYRQALIDVFDAREQCRRAAIRLVCSTVAFVDLAEIVQLQDETTTLAIAKNAIRDRLQTILPSADLKQTEAMVDLAFEEGWNMQGGTCCMGTVRDVILEVFSQNKSPVPSRFMDIQAYSSVLEGEAGLYHDIAKLFGIRRRGPMERLFTPTDIRTLMRHHGLSRSEHVEQIPTGGEAKALGTSSPGQPEVTPREVLEDTGPWDLESCQVQAQDSRGGSDKAQVIITLGARARTCSIEDNVPISEVGSGVPLSLEQKKKATNMVHTLPALHKHLDAKVASIEEEFKALVTSVHHNESAIKVVHDRTSSLESGFVALAKAGGITPSAIVPGLMFDRDSATALENRLVAESQRLEGALFSLQDEHSGEISRLQGSHQSLYEDHRSLKDEHRVLHDEHWALHAKHQELHRLHTSLHAEHKLLHESHFELKGKVRDVPRMNTQESPSGGRDVDAIGSVWYAAACTPAANDAGGTRSASAPPLRGWRAGR